MCSQKQTVIEGLLRYSVHLNGLWIPIHSVESTLARYTQLLVATNESKDYPISLVASCLAVKYRDRFLVLCTRHQVKDLDFQNIALLTENGKYSISSAGACYFEGIYETDYHDLVAFDFTEPCSERTKLRERFFKLREFPTDTTSEKVVCLIVSGYPSSDQNYDLANERKLGSLKRIITCKLDDGPNQSLDPTLLRLNPLEPLNFNPDGMSGDPAFVIQMENESPCAYFAGITTRAGENSFYIVRSRFVQKFLDNWIDYERN